jgi:hypothetical protein
MLAKITPASADFFALGRYLVNGKGGTPSPDRVQWVLAHNLGTDDVELAAKLMQATASSSPRCKKPVYHLMVAWHERERPSAEVQQAIALKTLQLAGLGEYQALVMGHGDTPHRHFHVMLNRVHPDTGKAWKTTDDYRKFDRIMRQLSDEYGFEYVPAHRFNPELTDELQQLPDSRAHRAAKGGAKTGRVKWSKAASREMGEYLSETLDRAGGVDDLEELAASLGLEFEAKGTGYVLGNAEGYATLSSLALKKSAQGYQRIHTPPVEVAVFKHSGRSWFDVDKVDITRAFMAWGVTDKDDLMQAIKDQQAERAARARPDTRTALSTLVTGSGKPAKPLKRPQQQRPTRDYMRNVIAAQTDKAAIERRRMMVAHRRRAVPAVQPQKSAEPDAPLRD